MRKREVAVGIVTEMPRCDEHPSMFSGAVVVDITVNLSCADQIDGGGSVAWRLRTALEIRDGNGVTFEP